MVKNTRSRSSMRLRSRGANASADGGVESNDEPTTNVGVPAATGGRQRLQRGAKDKVYAQEVAARQALGDVADREGNDANKSEEAIDEDKKKESKKPKPSKKKKSTTNKRKRAADDDDNKPTANKKSTRQSSRAKKKNATIAEWAAATTKKQKSTSTSNNSKSKDAKGDNAKTKGSRAKKKAIAAWSAANAAEQQSTSTSNGKTKQVEDGNAKTKKAAKAKKATSLTGRQNFELGAPVCKMFYDAEQGADRPYNGRVTGYDKKDKLYHVTYEDGDEEEMDEADLMDILVPKLTGYAKRRMKEKQQQGVNMHQPAEEWSVDDPASKEDPDSFKTETKSDNKSGGNESSAAASAAPVTSSPASSPYEEKKDGANADQDYKKDANNADQDNDNEEEMTEEEINAIKVNMGSSYQYSHAPDDIDKRDVDDECAHTAYLDELYECYRAREKTTSVRNTYMDGQKYLNARMRAILVDWLIAVHLKFKFVPETLYLTINIIDRYLELENVSRAKFQLLGTAALLLATKYEEIYPPELDDLVYICDKAYSRLEILQMEKKILDKLEYNVTIASGHAFLVRYLKAAHADRKIIQLGCLILDGTLLSYELLEFLPSQLAAATVYIARKTVGRNGWSPTLLNYTSYKEEDVKVVARAILDAKEKQKEVDGIDKKYKNERFDNVGDVELCKDF